jgi:putative ABC transport system permease protein
MQARRKYSGARVSFSLYGAGARLMDYAPELHLTAGRMFRPGLRELIASNSCARQYEHFGLGEERVIQGYEWRIVGMYDLGNTDGWCVVYADEATVLSAFRRDSYNEVDVLLTSPAAFDELRQSITANPQLRLGIRHQAEIIEEYTRQINGMLKFVSYFVGTILAVAAVIAACNSLYALVDSRRRELATLRAIGFDGLPVVTSTLSEAMLLAIPGALIGAGLAWLLFNGRAASSFDFQFRLAVTPSLVLLGIAWALGMGLIGGLLPAVRAARVPVTVALRAT